MDLTRRAFWNKARDQIIAETLIVQNWYTKANKARDQFEIDEQKQRVVRAIMHTCKSLFCSVIEKMNE